MKKKLSVDFGFSRVVSLLPFSQEQQPIFLRMYSKPFLSALKLPLVCSIQVTRAANVFEEASSNVLSRERFGMAEKNRSYGICGVYCGQCPSGNGRVKMIAGELKRLVDTVRYDWVEHVVKSFKFKEFRKGLEWFASAQCAMCLNGGGAPCENRKCAASKRLESCLLCNDYLTCKHTEYQRDWYPFVVDNYKRVKQVGFRKYLEEEEERARAGVDLMGHLERRCCKVVKLEDE